MRSRTKLFFFVLTFLVLRHGYPQDNPSGFVKKKNILESVLTYHSPTSTIERLLADLSQKFDLKFTYINNDLSLGQSRSIHCNSCTLKDVLNGLFSDGSVEYVPILSQILLKKKEESSAQIDSSDAKKDLTSLEALTANHTISDSIQIIVVKRGIVTKRKKQGKYVFKKGNLNLDYFNTLVEYEEIHSFVYDTLTNASDSSKPKIRTSKIFSHKKIVSTKRSPYWKISLSASLGSGLTYRAVSGTAQSSTPVDEFGGTNNGPGQRTINVGTRRDSIEGYKTNYFGGLALNYNLNKMILIKTGIGFTNLGEKGSYYSKGPRNSNGTIRDTNINYINDYNYLSIPIGLGCSVGNKIGVTISASIVTNIFLQVKTTYPEVSYTEYRYQGSPQDPNPRTFTAPSYYYKEYLDARNRSYRKVNFSFYADLELFFRINNFAKIFLSPTFSYGLNSIYSFKDNAKEIPFFYGLKGGIAFRLK